MDAPQSLKMMVMMTIQMRQCVCIFFCHCMPHSLFFKLHTVLLELVVMTQTKAPEISTFCIVIFAFFHSLFVSLFHALMEPMMMAESHGQSPFYKVLWWSFLKQDFRFSRCRNQVHNSHFMRDFGPLLKCHISSYHLR